jgi:hypothetical protein
MRTEYGLTHKTNWSKVLCCSLLGFATWGCPVAEPYYNENIGQEGVPVDPGAMSGTFALKLQSTTQTELPLLGKVTGGGDSYALVFRDYDMSDQTYTQETKLCGGLIRSENTDSTLPDESWQKVPQMESKQTDLRDGEGYLAVAGYIELWGLTNMDDPWNDPMPKDEFEAEEEPFAEQIVDMDEDGYPGMTIQVEGIVSGDFYFIQRKKANLEGIIVDEDRTFGLQVTHFEQTILGTTSGPTQQGYPQEPHPDPRQSWFEEIRLPSGSSCDDVMQAVEDGTMSRLRPF